MSQLGSRDFLSGATGAAVNELMQNELGKAFKDNPDMHQWASALLGGVVSEIATGNATAGASAASSGTKWNELDQKLAKQNAHIPRTETEVLDGAEQNLNSPYAITAEDLGRAILGNAYGTTSDKSMKMFLSKEFPNYISIESYPGSNNRFKIIYPSGGKLVSTTLAKVPIASGGSLLIKLSADQDNGREIDWSKEITKFYTIYHTTNLVEPIAKKALSAGGGASIAGPAGIVVAVVAGGVADVVVNNEL